MAHTTITRIISKEFRQGIPITIIEFEDGGEVYRASAGGHAFQPGDPIITYFDDRYSKVKFNLDTGIQHNSPPHTSYKLEDSRD